MPVDLNDIFVGAFRNMPKHNYIIVTKPPESSESYYAPEIGEIIELADIRELFAKVDIILSQYNDWDPDNYYRGAATKLRSTIDKRQEPFVGMYDNNERYTLFSCEASMVRKL